MISGKPPRFKPASAPRVRTVIEENKYHSRSGETAYGYRWQKFSLKFRRANPWCRFCQQRGRDTPATQVDHIKPWDEFPDLRYVWSNCQSLCDYDHAVTKQKMENYARKHGLLDKLPEWCADPTSRPDELKPFGDLV